MTYRDVLAKDAPITIELVEKAWIGEIDWCNDNTRSCVFAVWALLRYEWADAMIRESDSVRREQAAREAEKTT